MRKLSILKCLEGTQFDTYTLNKKCKTCLTTNRDHI